MTCEDCLSYDACLNWTDCCLDTDRACDCEWFKNKADFVEMTGYQVYGYVEFPPDEVFEDELDVVKADVLSKTIEFIKREAEENPDFFIVCREESGDPLTRNSVGLKVYLPKRRDE